MKRTAAVLAVLLVGAAAQGDSKKELEKFQGTWSVVGVEQGGQKAPEEKIKEARLKLVITGDKFAYQTGDRKLTEGSFQIDPDKKPKTLDAKGTNQQGQAEQTVGIYEFDGDTLRVCFVPSGQERPKEFKTGAGSEATLITYKRDKK